MALSYRACTVAVRPRLEWGSRSKMKYAPVGDGEGGVHVLDIQHKQETSELTSGLTPLLVKVAH